MITGFVFLIVSIAGVAALWFVKSFEIRTGRESSMTKFSRQADPLLERFFKTLGDFYASLHSWRFNGLKLANIALRVFCVRFLVGAKRFFDKQFFVVMNFIRGRKFLSGRDVHSVFLKDILEYKHRLTKDR